MLSMGAADSTSIMLMKYSFMVHELQQRYMTLHSIKSING